MSPGRILTVAAAAAAAAAATVAAAPAPGERPGDYAVALRVVPAPGGGVQRLDLPAAALVALRNRDGSDLRIFDGGGRAVATARIAAAPRVRRDPLHVAPLLGPRDLPAGARVSVRLDAAGQARLTEVESAPPADGAAIVTGALLDARRTGGRARQVDLTLDLPPGRPVALTVEASPDLDRWRRLGRRVAYRDPGTAGPVTVTIALDGARLDRDMLKVTWRDEARPGAPVAVRGAKLVRTEAAAPVTVTARPPGPASEGDIEFLTPATPIAALRIVPVPADGPVPVQLLGRDDAEQPWRRLASGIAGAGQPPLAIDGAPRIVRIAADRRGGGFSASPAIELRLVPRALAFVASGPAPFTLAVGRAGAADLSLPPDALGPAGDLPRAAVADPGGGPLRLAAPDLAAPAQRRAALWAVLLVAVAVLGGLVWFLVRKPQQG